MSVSNEGPNRPLGTIEEIDEGIDNRYLKLLKVDPKWLKIENLFEPQRLGADAIEKVAALTHLTQEAIRKLEVAEINDKLDQRQLLVELVQLAAIFRTSPRELLEKVTYNHEGENLSLADASKKLGPNPLDPEKLKYYDWTLASAGASPSPSLTAVLPAMHKELQNLVTAKDSAVKNEGVAETNIAPGKKKERTSTTSSGTRHSFTSYASDLKKMISERLSSSQDSSSLSHDDGSARKALTRHERKETTLSTTSSETAVQSSVRSSLTATPDTHFSQVTELITQQGEEKGVIYLGSNSSGIVVALPPSEGKGIQQFLIPATEKEVYLIDSGLTPGNIVNLTHDGSKDFSALHFKIEPTKFDAQNVKSSAELADVLKAQKPGKEQTFSYRGDIGGGILLGPAGPESHRDNVFFVPASDNERHLVRTALTSTKTALLLKHDNSEGFDLKHFSLTPVKKEQKKGWKR